jgi:RNA polymerase sigma factor (sigma-70 family)
VPPTDEELAAAAAAGDLAAFDLLMQRYEEMAYRAAYGFAGSRDDALDIVQAAFLKAYRDLAKFRGRSALKTWLMRIVLNEGYDWRRGQRRRGERGVPLDWLAERAAPGPDPEDATLRRESRARLGAGLRLLKRRHSLAVVLRYFDEMRIAEIAAILGCSELTTRNMLFRSLRRLRAELADGSQGTT